MAATVPHDIPALYEPSLFGTYSKKIGMWLFLLSDSLTFGALLYAYSYGRISTPNWPTPFHSESIVNATVMTAFLLTSSLTMVLAVRAAVDGNLTATFLTVKSILPGMKERKAGNIITISSAAARRPLAAPWCKRRCRPG